jgi:Rap1a immunity proteins
MVVRCFCILLACTLASATAGKAEESTATALYRKCETYLAGVSGKHLSADEANDASYCVGFIDRVVAAARLAHARHGLLFRNGEPPGNVDKAAYQAFSFGIQLGTDLCLPDKVAPQEVAKGIYRWGRLNPELLYGGEVSFLYFVLLQYLCH